MGHNGGKVDGEASLTGIQPLYSGRVAKPWDPGLNTIIVMGGASQVVVLELHVVYPAIHKLWDHLLQVEPECEPVTSLATNVVHCGSLIEPSLYLAASISRDQDDWVQS